MFVTLKGFYSFISLFRVSRSFSYHYKVLSRSSSTLLSIFYGPRILEVIFNSLSFIYKKFISAKICHKTNTLLSMSSSTTSVAQLIPSNRVVVFGTTECPYCKKAWSFLRRIGFPSSDIKLVYLNMGHGGSGLRHNLIARTGIKTVPVIFIKGTLIGGYSDLKEIHSHSPLNGWLLVKIWNV